jgi:hypothetical protein
MNKAKLGRIKVMNEYNWDIIIKEWEKILFGLID